MKRHFNFLAVALLLIAATAACGGEYEHVYASTTDLAISPTTMVLFIDETDSLTVNTGPLNAVIQSVAWTSSNNNVATVLDGIVTAITAGTAIITFTVSDINHNTIEATSIVTVYHPIERDFVKVEGGTFKMGCSDDECGEPITNNEEPHRDVTLSDFRISIYTVTQAQWKFIMGGNNPSYTIGDNLPVEQVSWEHIVGTLGASMIINGMTYYEDGFVYKFNQLTGGRKYRLPTEAEWEYAARGGKESKEYKYSGSNNADEVAWHAENSGDKIHPVGMKKHNELGIYDMSGNVSEWVWDFYRNTYPGYAETDPKGPLTNNGAGNVARGGNWNSVSRAARVSYRVAAPPKSEFPTYGFRLVMSETKESETKFK